MKQTKRLLALLLVMAMVIMNVPAPVFAVGTTNADGYIEVRTIQDLYNVRLDLTANYILMNDIDLTTATAVGGDWDFMGNGWNPIGSNDIYADAAFSGEFNGNGHKIIGMRIWLHTVPSGVKNGLYVGLFANVTGSVRDLTFEDCTIRAAYANARVGTVTGKSSGIIHNVVADTDITATKDSCQIGGIVGENSGQISQCANYGDLNYSYTSNNDRDECVGGIAGRATGGSIVECFNAGNVLAENYYSSIGAYTVKAGGIVGFVRASSGAPVTINFCYNVGNITNYYQTSQKLGEYAGGIAGDMWYANITGCYNAGKATKAAIGHITYAGSIKDTYYLAKSGHGSTGATSLTEAQMRLQTMFAGFDFDNIWILNEYANYPYPQLRSNIQDMGESAELVSIIAPPIKTEYFTGDTLDFTGAMVKVVYVSGREEIIDITDDIVSGFAMNTVGEQKVTVTVAGASDTYTINVTQRPVVSGVSIILEPNTKTFAVGTTFDFTGAKAKISYVGGVTEYKDITVEATTGGNINHVGKQTITYTFGGKSATFEVEVVGVALEKIVVTKLPDKRNYMEGQELDLTGMVVTAVMNNGIENTVGTGYTVSGYSSVPGTHTITVAYLGKTVTFEVTVAERKLVSLALNTLPNKLEYVSGQTFDESGMQVIATYDNGDVEVAEDYTLSGFDSTPGIKTIVISLDGQSVSFPAKVIARVITEFKLVSTPSKLDYIEYEAFDPTGLKAEATYNDGETEVVTDYDLAGFSSKPGTHTITVAFEGFVKSFEINVVPRVLEDIKVIAPHKVTYYIGEAFDATGMEVIACYNNGQEIAVDDYKVSGFESAAPGAKTVTVTYGGMERSFAIVVQERSVVEANGSFIVDDLVGRLGEEIRLPVTVTCNTGIAGLRHEISFEASNLKFVSVEMKGDYANGTLIVNEEDAANGKVTILWFSNEDVQAKGLVYELVFTIQETAVDGVTEVKLDFNDNDHGNVSGENVLLGHQDGSVEVRSYWLGDLNGDRKYAMVDLVMLAQYVAGFDMTMSAKQLLSADVNEDGNIDIHDVILLNQWLLAEDF